MKTGSLNDDYISSSKKYSLRDHLECIRICGTIQIHIRKTMEKTGSTEFAEKLQILQIIQWYHKAEAQAFLELTGTCTSLNSESN